MMRAANASTPMLTVIVLARENTSYTFRQMLGSLQSQTLAALRVWVLDCNTPGDPYSLSLQEDIAAMRDVQLLPFTQAQSVAGACNSLLAQVESPYVGFVNSCDSWYPYKAERQLQELEANGTLKACLCNGYRRQSRTDHVDSRLIFAKPETEPAKWLASDQLTLSSQVIYRTEALREAGGFDPEMNTRMDQDAVLRMCGPQTLKIIAEPLFDNTVSYAPSMETDYQSLRYLMRKHYDILLRNRRQFYFMNMKLARMASQCTLWLQAAVHFFVAVWKMPLYALGRAVSRGVSALGRFVARLRKERRVRGGIRKLKRSLRPLREREAPPAPMTFLPDAAGLEAYTLDPAKDNRPLAFAGSKKLRNAVIPEHMTRIPYGMFAGCKNLERVVIPSTVTHIDACAFLGCGKLRQVEVAQGSQLTYIADYAFGGCALIGSLRLPCNINHMGAYAFAGCASLTEISFVYNEQGRQVVKPLYPAVMDGIPAALFAGCRSLQQVEFAEGSMLRFVGNEAFLGCASLHHVYVNGQISAIGEWAFARCVMLEGFVFPQIDGVEHIGRNAFYHCESLTHFRLPYAMKTIRRSCFEGCLALKYVKVPKKVLYIEQQAYLGCRDLESVILISANTKYAPNAFENHTRIEHS